MTLDDAIAALYVREINCGCETFWDGGIKVCIGGAINGHHVETMFSRENMGRAGIGWSTRPRGSTAELLIGTSTAPPASTPSRSVPMSSSAAASELGPH
jgi:hypothetical protein